MNEIKWRRPGSPLVRDDIERVEYLVGYKFPNDYVSCALLYHGASVIPYRIDCNKNERVFANLLSFSDKNVDNIIEVYNNCKGRLKNGIIPFACDPAGNLFCFDYRKDKEKPSIVFLNKELSVNTSDYSKNDLERINLEEVQEKAIEFICTSFSEMLNMLH